MSSAPNDPFRLPVRILTAVGLTGLAVLTLLDRGATRMYAFPWTWVQAAVLATPPLLLLLRLGVNGIAFRLPAPAWLTTAGLTVLVPLLGSLFSPFRESSLLLAAGPLAAACLFLLLYDWLNGTDNRHRVLLERILAGAAGVLVITSTLQWLSDLVAMDRAALLSREVFEMRNPHPLGHSNYTAGLMLLGLPWLGWLAWRSCGWLRVAWVVALILAMLALFTSGSRGGLLGLAALAAVGVCASGLGWKRMLLFTGAGVVLVSLLAVANPRIRDFLGPRDPLAEPNLSTVQRTAMLEAGVRMGRDRPLLGWGPGTTPLVYPRYRAVLAGGAENVLQLNSTPLQLWAETGAAGLLGALLLGGLIARHWRRSPVAAVTLAGYLVFALTDYQLDVPVFAAAVATLAALLADGSLRAGINSRRGVAFTVLVALMAILVLGRRDPAPFLNGRALALAGEQAGRTEAVTLLQSSLRLNPDQEIAHFNLGWLLLVPDPAQAEHHFLAAARLVPDKGGVYFGLGLARLNQGRTADAAATLALECINDPRFLASPWWTEPAIALLRDAAAKVYEEQLTSAVLPASNVNPWLQQQVALLRTLAPRLGRAQSVSKSGYRRERIGYPVLMRNLDITPPVDLYDVREDPHFPETVSFPLPGKGWLPSPLLLKLLDDTVATRH